MWRGNCQLMERIARYLGEVFVSLLLITIAGCSFLGEGKEPFPWFAAGNVFVYDYFSAGDTLKSPDGESIMHLENAVRLEIVDTEFSPGFEVRITTISEIGYVPIIYLLGAGVAGLEQRNRGLFGFAFSECDINLLPIMGSSFLRVPANPFEGQELKTYRCIDNVQTVLVIDDIQHEIGTKAGQFTTFIIKSKETREYWSKTDGLIRWDNLDRQGEIDYYYQLSSIHTARD